MPKDRKSVKQATNKHMAINQKSLLTLQPNRHLAQTKSTNCLLHGISRHSLFILQKSVISSIPHSEIIILLY